MLEDNLWLGSCPIGQIENFHIEAQAVIANSVADFGLIVGRDKYTGTNAMRIVNSANIYPTGVSCGGFVMSIDGKAIACMNNFLFRNKNLVAVQSTDESIEIGKAVFIDQYGFATQTVTSGWRIGLAYSPIRFNGLNINGEIGAPYFLLEMADPMFIGGV
jgi:hypothetical protein